METILDTRYQHIYHGTSDFSTPSDAMTAAQGSYDVPYRAYLSHVGSVLKQISGRAADGGRHE